MTKKQTEHNIALYRKYRPETFSEVIGQDHIKEVLQGAITSGSVAHAYLFAGTRGTGKTTMARIFAKSVGASVNDIYEIDAASNRGIDDIRQLRDGIATLPFESPYKVYIIDEVHMLTKDAFNALLKTLEEPPKHVIFILATTELDKVLETIVSRCQVFNFQKPSQSVLRTMLINIAEQEGKKLEPTAADLMAVLGDGSFRDAQGVLQKILSITVNQKEITATDVERVTGAPSRTLINTLIQAYANHDLDNVLATLENIVEQNMDVEILLRLLIHKVRFVLLLRFSKSAHDTLRREVSDDSMVFLQDMAGMNGKEVNSNFLLKLLEVHDRMRHVSIKQLPLELAFIELLGQDTTP